MYFTVKRILDFFFACLLLILLSPIMIIVSIVIATTMGRPILFTQNRIGFQNKVFKVFKFRTMTSDTDAHGNLLPDHQRLSSIGALIRSLSLDELPQLFNIIQGSMSFIGPRPLISEYGALYNNEQRKRHDVMPGISGWSQVNGRNELTWEKKFKLDLYYVKHCSFLLDCKIVALTIYAILARKGINQGSITTMAKFNGKN